MADICYVYLESQRAVQIIMLVSFYVGINVIKKHGLEKTMKY